MRRLLVLGAWWLVGCSQPSAQQEDVRRVLLQGLGDHVILPNYREFEDRAFELSDAVSGLCSEPSAETLESAEQAWWQARAPWKRNDVVAFGPYSRSPTYYGAEIDFWPCRVDTVEEVLAGTDPFAPEDLTMLGASARGFPVIEYLLYDPDLDLVAASAPGSRRCDYLVALAADLGAKATAIREAWDPDDGNFLGELVQAGRGSEKYDSIDKALGEVVNRLVFALEAARGDKLAAPLGNRTGGTPQPDTAESRFSGRSLEDVRDNLRGVEAVCFGAEGATDASLAHYLDGIDRSDLVSLLRQAFDATYAALDAVPEPLTDAILADPASVQAAIDAIIELQRLIQVDVINSMGLMLTFSDADGD